MKYSAMIDVIRAFATGDSIIQAKGKDPDDRWEDSYEPSWDFSQYDYRVKPEPRSWWIVRSVEYPNTPVPLCETQDEAEDYQHDRVHPLEYEVVHVRELV